MARIEKSSAASAEELAQFKEEIKREVRSGRKKRVSIFPLILLLLVAAIVVATLWVVAATGFVSIPFVSAYAYKPPQPSRVVSAGEPLQTVFSSSVNTLLTNRLQAGGGELTDRSFKMELPDSSFTQALQEGLGNRENNLFDVTRVQMAAVAGKGLEIFLPFQNNPQQTALLLVINPRLENGHILFDPPIVQLGSLTLPRWVSATLLMPPLQQGIALFEQQLGRTMHLQDILVIDGFLRVSGELQVEVTEIQQLP